MKRCDRNRKRSKRRAIYCPVHQCYLDSTSRKYPLFADSPEQLQQRGVKRRSALMLIKSCTAIPLSGEWLEEFWCQACQETRWYHVCRSNNSADRGDQFVYKLSTAPPELWQQVSGVTCTGGNPSVSEFTRRAARNKIHQNNFRYETTR